MWNIFDGIEEEEKEGLGLYKWQGPFIEEKKHPTFFIGNSFAE